MVGADSVPKKLGDTGFTVVNLGSSTAINVSSYEGYKNFSVNNFFITASGASCSVRTTSRPTGNIGESASTSISKSYDSVNGIFYVYGTTGTNNGSFQGVQFYRSVTISIITYLVY